ncbi:uncharacterized protein JCM6883_005640 [Sporobolomyces salmoneus]|uniref:uncharacterized protein n=1 Tax=Sporobolomyces salmoneus TaxID=183962 RepID=UPI0031794BA9
MFITSPLSLVVSLALFSPLVSSHAAPPNPDQLYALQRSAYLAAATTASSTTSTVAHDAPRRVGHHSGGKEHHRKVKKSLEKKIRREIEARGNSSTQTVERVGGNRNGPEVVAKRSEREGKVLRKKNFGASNHDTSLDRLYSRVSSHAHAQKIDVAPSNELSKRGDDGGKIFKGVSSYYLFALDDSPRRAVLDAIKAGGFSVVRIFLDGVHHNCKGSGNSAVPDLEPDRVGEYDDTILYKIDKLMADCSDRGLKLMIALSDRYALGFWSTNSYALNLKIISPSQKGQQSLKIKDASSFYSNEWAIQMFEKRISRALNHENQLLGRKKWKDLSSVVYAFEAQNEPQGYMTPSNPSWVCDRSKYIASQLSGSGILISSGGGTDTSHSLESWATGCSAIDVVSVHDYGTNGWSTASTLAKAKQNHPGKTIVMGEWGVTGSNKAKKIGEFVEAFEKNGIPWMYWQITSPGAGDKDFEVWTSEPAWNALTGGSYSYSSPTGGSSKNNDDKWNSTQSSSSTWKSESKTSSSAAWSASATNGGKNSTISSTQSSNYSSSVANLTSSSSIPSQTLNSSVHSAPTPLATPSSSPNATLSSSLSNVTIPTQNLTVVSIEASSLVETPSSTESSLLPLATDNSISINSSPSDPALDPAISESTTSPLSIPIESPSTSPEVPLNTPISSSSESAAVDPLVPTPVAEPTPTESLASEQIPVPSPSSLDSSLPPLPNCNYTLPATLEADVLHGNITLDVSTSIAHLPSGIICNATILPPLPPVLEPVPSPSPSPLLVFSSDSNTLLPIDVATELAPPSPEPELPSTPTIPQQQENDTALVAAAVDVPTPVAQVDVVAGFRRHKRKL